MLVHQDRPKYEPVLKVVLVMPAVVVVAGLYLWFTGDASGGLALLPVAVVMGLVFWLVFPREYQVYEDHLRTVLGGPFSVKVGFENVETTRITGRLSSSINFITRITRSYVEIVKRKGMSIAITPADAESFVENANLVLSQWARTGADRT